MENGASLAPNVTVRENSRITKNTCVERNTTIGKAVTTLSDVMIYPNKKYRSGYGIMLPQGRQEFILQSNRCKEVKR